MRKGGCPSNPSLFGKGREGESQEILRLITRGLDGTGDETPTY